jgi:hypothetical protein
VAQNTDNKQLELVSKIKGLETLRIRRSQLKPDSLAIFAKMPSLKASHPWTKMAGARQIKPGLKKLCLIASLSPWWILLTGIFSRRSFIIDCITDYGFRESPGSATG